MTILEEELFPRSVRKTVPSLTPAQSLGLRRSPDRAKEFSRLLDIILPSILSANLKRTSQGRMSEGCAPLSNRAHSRPSLPATFAALGAPMQRFFVNAQD